MEPVTMQTPPPRAGVFVPVFALRSEGTLGIGDTGSVREMIDWCHQHSLSVLQLLPINETSDDNSPYNAVSSVALDFTTLRISPDQVPCLETKDFEELAPLSLREELELGPVAYRRVKPLKMQLLRRAYMSLLSRPKGDTEKKEFERFEKEEKRWVKDYSRFRALMDLHGHPNWEEWPLAHQSPKALKNWLKTQPTGEKDAFVENAGFYRFVQWVLCRQWSDVRAYADERGVMLMGDIPYGVSRYSSDVWANPEWFDLQWSGGAPPEPFFKQDRFTELWGQNWGVPLYRWEAMKEDGYTWWRRRVQGVARYFRMFRIDHVLGFYRIYAFPWKPQDNGLYTDMTREQVGDKLGHLPRFFPGDDSVPEEAVLNCGHGEELLRMVLDAAGESIVLAEDLGVVPHYVRPSLEKLGISGFKIPVFEREENSGEYKDPDEYSALTIATLSTHDHETMAGFWDGWWSKYEELLRLREEGGKIEPEFEQDATHASWDVYRTQRFAGLDDHTMIRAYNPEVREAIQSRLLGCASWLVVFMITDLFGWKHRFNVPGPVADSNWSERLPYTVSELGSHPDLERVRAFIRDQVRESGRLA